MYENTRHLSDEPVKFSIFVLIKFFEKYKKNNQTKQTYYYYYLIIIYVLKQP